MRRRQYLLESPGAFYTARAKQILDITGNAIWLVITTPVAIRSAAATDDGRSVMYHPVHVECRRGVYGPGQTAREHWGGYGQGLIVKRFSGSSAASRLALVLNTNAKGAA
jgi:hypothetical protein